MLVLAIGCDGAPNGGTLFLASFMNVGRLASSVMMIYGTSGSVTAPAVRSFMYHLTDDLAYLEREVFKIDVCGVERKVEFRVGELPQDMKMLNF